ncbi:hypothetical protein CLV92_10985 [Kineococcus xinjiangensis]|uniref:Uncharacterized protein n=1 Tax=Kineococcus xinjiangensis TaxID=512762 RepID=A0A2S6IHY5_9ACTN|nr:hypothetical protein [Kineococcus xinjiangensis]PPK93808.1 hypothetical protein CLV92_10985 [Kineococcus xinjiangensis]
MGQDRTDAPHGAELDGAAPPGTATADGADATPQATTPQATTPQGTAIGPEPAMVALDELCDAVRASIVDLEHVLVRAEAVRAQRAQGRSFAEIAPLEARPLAVELISGTMSRLAETGSRWRREEARALRAEGLSMDRIAQLFGVTRQRVSALLAGGRQQDSATS